MASVAAVTLVAALLAPEPSVVTGVDVVGLSRTREETVLRLLPRAPPARYSRAEVLELERRLNNLGIFDFVSVSPVGSRLTVRVREKWTLIPKVELSTGSSLEDSAALLGVIEYNFLGSANQLALNVVRAERGWGLDLAFLEHPYRRDRWALSSALGIATAERRFDANARWHTATFGMEAALTSPAWISDHLNYTLGWFYARETVSAPAEVEHPESSHFAGNRLAFVWDAYQWEDLAPRGIYAELGGGVGFAMDRSQARPRHYAELRAHGSLRLSSTTALMARGAAAALTRGDSNFSLPLGSLTGVRGLRDGHYFNWAQSFANLELRQSVRFAPRWAAQAVVFADAAAFEQLQATGARGQAGQALSVGGGVRVVPTWLASIVLRLDLARLLMPEQRWFLQLGLGQYF